MITTTARHSIRPGRWLAAVAFSALLTALSCREHLPAYEDPTDLFEAKITVTFVYRSDDVSLIVSLVLVNRFDETLEEVVDVDGTITVTLPRDVSTARTFTLSPAQLSGAGYDPFSRRLRIDPGQSATFQVRYDFRDDRGRNLIGEVLSMRADPRCGARMISAREVFEVQGSARLFPRTRATVAVPLRYEICLPYPFVDDRVCIGPKGDHPETNLCL